MNSLVLCLLSLALIGLVFGSAWVALRHHRYCRQLKYDPHQNFALGVAPKSVEAISIVCDSTGFILPKLTANAVTVFLELHLQYTATGLVFDPSVKISWEAFCDKQFFERGVSGIRFLNLTRLGAKSKAACASYSNQMWAARPAMIRPARPGGVRSAASMALVNPAQDCADGMIVRGP